jgi:hypothetical protein
MIKVYFESKNHAELVATFENESIYIACLPTLKKVAKSQGMEVTESIDEYLEETHENLRSVLIEYNCEEYGDAIIDSICNVFNYPTTIEYYKEE